MRILYICAALAAGEGLAALAPGCAEAWPILVGVAVLAALFGYGYAVPGWGLVVVFLLGAALFLFAAVADEREYREAPWMRGARRHVRAEVGAQRGFASLRRDLARRVGLGLDHDSEVAALNRAILLGAKADMPPQTKRVFVASGTIHVFAISGLHVMVVARVLVLLMALCLVPLRWQGVCALLPLWGYVWVVGASPSAVRAAAMASFYYGAGVFWRRPNALHAWALTFILVHVARPGQIAEVGSLLSFSVMLALVLAGRVAGALGRGWRQVLFLSLAAWSASVPIAAHAFGRITPGALAANFVLLPTAGCSVACGALGVLASYVSTAVAEHVNNAAAIFTRAMADVAEAVSRIPGASLEVPPWPLGRCLAWYLALVLTGVLIRFRQHARNVI